MRFLACLCAPCVQTIRGLPGTPTALWNGVTIGHDDVEIAGLTIGAAGTIIEVASGVSGFRLVDCILNAEGWRHVLSLWLAAIQANNSQLLAVSRCPMRLLQATLALSGC